MPGIRELDPRHVLNALDKRPDRLNRSALIRAIDDQRLSLDGLGALRSRPVLHGAGDLELGGAIHGLGDSAVLVGPLEGARELGGPREHTAHVPPVELIDHDPLVLAAVRRTRLLVLRHGVLDRLRQCAAVLPIRFQPLLILGRRVCTRMVVSPTRLTDTVL